jgi:5-methylcytosine-specific restriction enzyme subunit McrC
MRTIRLREHRTTRETLTESELQSLLSATSLVALSHVPGERDLYELRPGSRVGTLVFEDLRVLIQPKVNLRNLFFLLGFGDRLIRWDPALFAYETEPDLLQAVGWAFEAEVARSLRQGLVRGYVSRAETLATVRGRIDFVAQQRRRHTRPFPLECVYEDYTEDIELNQIVKAAHWKLRRVHGLNQELAKRLLYRHRSFADVSDIEYPPLEVPTLVFDRLTEHWEGAARLAELVLRYETLLDREGMVMASSFIVDMNRLFEQFISRIAADEAERAGWDLVPQAGRWLSPGIRMRPDLLLHRHGSDRAVSDVKYKELEIQDWPRADLYQLLAYCSALGLPQGLLIYADYREPERHVVHNAGVRLEVMGIDMGAHPDELARQAREAARRLLEHAEGTAPSSPARTAKTVDSFGESI